MRDSHPARVSLICTVRDEEDSIGALLDSMVRQSRAPDEIIVNDCGSGDATATIVRDYVARYPIITLVAGGHNISSGRNHAIHAATGEIIACTDAGLVLHEEWLARLIAPIEQHEADLVGGFFEAVPQSLFEEALAATNYRHVTEIEAARFLPFGKCMAFRRAAWETVGGFPEWAYHCEDILFDRAIIAAGYRCRFVPDALVFFRPRTSLCAFAQQYYWYARGDGRAGLWPWRYVIRYGTYLGLVGLFLQGRRSRQWRTIGALLVASGGVAYTRRPYHRLWPRLGARSAYQRLVALALVPVIRVVGDVAKMVGYPVGWWIRYRNR